MPLRSRHGVAVAACESGRNPVWWGGFFWGRRQPLALFDTLTILAERAKVAEDHASQAAAQTREQLRAEVERARKDAQDQAAKLQESAPGAEAKMSQWWAEMQQNWRDHTAKVSNDIQARKQDHDAARAADRAEADAIAAVEFALAAIEEAEYTVLDARLARMEADQKSSKS
ncbi:hypothetical protein [Kitasatospora sp. NPDC017646]|uniref:hypothetical protein n=1 Tax=Kitasatospora sp. NPDC017646 TaxID=3364024 RepID=UPI00379E1850